MWKTHESVISYSSSWRRKASCDEPCQNSSRMGDKRPKCKPLLGMCDIHSEEAYTPTWGQQQTHCLWESSSSVLAGRFHNFPEGSVSVSGTSVSSPVEGHWENELRRASWLGCGQGMNEHRHHCHNMPQHLRNSSACLWLIITPLIRINMSPFRWVSSNPIWWKTVQMEKLDGIHCNPYLNYCVFLRLG